MIHKTVYRYVGRKGKCLCGILLISAIVVSGCGKSEKVRQSDNAVSSNTGVKSDGVSAGSGIVSSNEIFSDRDFEVGYDEDESISITLSGSSAECESDSVQISENMVTITEEGTYILTGTLENGMVIVDSDKTDKVQLVLDNVSIHSETSAPIYIRQSDKVFITMAEGSDNTLSNGGSFEEIDENQIDAVIFSKEDLTLNGSGDLKITSPAGHGIVSKDELILTSGRYIIDCASHGLSGKDTIGIANGDLNITSGKDGIHAENADDEELGFIYIQSGTFQIKSEGDGISAAAYMQIEDGSFDIISGGGSVNAEEKGKDMMGGFMGGGFDRDMEGGRRGDMKGNAPSDNNVEERRPEGDMKGTTPPDNDNLKGSGTDNSSDKDTDTETDISMKGIKANGQLLINGGSYTIDSADDSVHSNTSVTVHDGTFEISSGDDGFHSDETLTITGGTIRITECYEGIEGLHVDISGGNIELTADDDGLNAAGGTDQSGFGGNIGNDRFGGMGKENSESSGSITISGGTIQIKASGDGIDANGSLTISGGDIIVSGPAQGDTATLDYDTTGIITGGTFIGTGALGMAQNFSDSEQGVVFAKVGNQSADTTVILVDSAGNEILSYEPELSYVVVILSSPDIIKGETYTLTVGSSTQQITAE